MQDHGRRWINIWMLWTFYGLVTADQTHYCYEMAGRHYEMAGRPVSWARTVLAEATFGWIWALVTPAVLWMAYRFPFAEKRRRMRTIEFTASWLIMLPSGTRITLSGGYRERLVEFMSYSPTVRWRARPAR